MEDAFRRLMRGEQRGLMASTARLALCVPEFFYSSVMRLRNFAFDLGVLTSQRVPIPVISVGNITTGGTGKTPFVALVCDICRAAGVEPGIVSRGYRAATAEGNDEKKVLEILTPGVPHEQNSARIVAAQRLLNEHPHCGAIVMDDGLQHRHLHRDLNVVLIDATCPFGYDHVLPRGLLREPLSGLRRADVILLTRCDLVHEEQLREIERRARSASGLPAEKIFRTEFRPSGVRTASGRQHSIESLRGLPVYLASGIGNPEAFHQTCRSAGLTIAGTRWFPDHHDFSEADLRDILSNATAAGASTVVMTLKDLVKLPSAGANVLALEIAPHFSVTEQRQTLESLIRNVLRRT
ncbi:MAG: tetraacyldisaccharide 4'-kinase [Planctomycetaceae bacterium]|nr:tetraacyldisaccharide 4'-kinase [Planctomycetaceae bacterium]